MDRTLPGGGVDSRSDAPPVLVEDRSRIDWQIAEYVPHVQVYATYAVITHKVRHAPTIQSLVADGRARWATELRVPKTLHSRVVLAGESTQRLEWSLDDAHGDLFVIPGLLAVREIDLRPEPDELIPLWRDTRCRVGRGWWLARGLARRGKSLGQSLLTFMPDDKLANGRMRVLRAPSDDELRFHVRLAKDIWPRRGTRDVQIAALIGAMGQMIGAYPDPESEPAMVRELRGRLEAEGVAAWTEPDDYDPALAATVIEPFVVPGQADD